MDRHVDSQASIQKSARVINGGIRSPNFPEEAEYQGLYWSLWWFGTGGWVKHVARIIWTLLNNIYVIPTLPPPFMHHGYAHHRI